MSVVHLVTSSKNGRYIAFAAGSLLTIWDLENKVEVVADGLMKNQHSDVIRFISFSDDTKYFLSGGDDKSIKIFNVSDWSLLAIRFARKKLTCGVFVDEPYITKAAPNPNQHGVLVSDKFGETFFLPCKKSINTEEELTSTFLGHISIITAMIRTPDSKFIITCDRDEHATVTKNPRLFDIQAICLGHTKAVIGCAVVQNDPLLIATGSADSSIRLWNGLNASQLSLYTFPNSAVVAAIAFVSNLLVVAIEGDSNLHVFKTTNSTITPHTTVSTQFQQILSFYVDQNQNFWVCGKSTTKQPVLVFKVEQEKLSEITQSQSVFGLASQWLATSTPTDEKLVSKLLTTNRCELRDFKESDEHDEEGESKGNNNNETNNNNNEGEKNNNNNNDKKRKRGKKD